MKTKRSIHAASIAATFLLGAVPLPILERLIDEWIAKTLATA